MKPHTQTYLQVYGLQTSILIHSTLCNPFQEVKRTFGVFVTTYATLLGIFLTKENFGFKKASMKNKSSVYISTCLMSRRIPSRLASGSTFKTLLHLHYPDMFTPQYDLRLCPLMSCYRVSGHSGL